MSNCLFCEIAFLEKVVNDYLTHPNSLSDLDDNEQDLQDFRSMLLRKIIPNRSIVFDDYKRIYSIANSESASGLKDVCKRIIKGFANKTTTIVDNEHIPSREQVSQGNMSLNQMLGTYFVNDENLIHDLKRHGIICLTPSLSHNAQIYVNGGKYVPKKDDEINWSNVLLSSIPDLTCNSIVFIDNYIAKDYWKQLVKILASIVRANPDTEIQITVITSKQNRRTIYHSDGSSHAEPYLITRNGILRNLANEGIDCGRLFIEVCQLNDRMIDEHGQAIPDKTYQKFHNRCIISNNFIFKSEDGFDIPEGERWGKTFNFECHYPMFITSNDIYRSAQEEIVSKLKDVATVIISENRLVTLAK